MRIFLGFGLLMASLSSSLSAASAFWLPAIFGDHMVVQARQGIEVWGRDAPATVVTVKLATESVDAISDGAGLWSAHLDAMPAGGPYTLSVQGSESRVFTDVLVGEVWLASGQSNMELALRATKDRDKDIAKANLPNLRFFTVDRAAAFQPLDDVSGHWQVCTPQSAPDFSAVAFYFGRELHEARNGEPVGMIAASWGGTPGEDWVPRAALDAEAPFKGLMADWDKAPGRKELWSKGEAYELQLKDLRLVKADGSSFPLPLGGWTPNEKPGSTGKVTQADGVLSYQGRIQGSAWGSETRVLRAVQSQDAPMDLRPYLGFAFKARGEGTFTATLGEPSVSDNDDFASAPFTVGHAWAEHSIPIAAFKQGGWGEPRVFTPQSISQAAFVVQVPFWPELGGVAYNGMIAPLTRFPLKGVLWYQGESNVGRPGQYADLLRLLVRQWRKAWGREDLAFLAVQLPGYVDPNLKPADANWAQLRESQERAMDSLPHTGLAVTLDLGERDNIHPKNKMPVGKRLALLALAGVYGRKIEAVGPRPGKLSAEGATLRLAMSHAKGLELRTPDPSGFEVAGPDGVFHAAQARVDGESLLLWNKAIADPRALRYAWADDPAAELYNGDGLPAAPFRVQLP
jgi:sialate O-acetylesterase